MINETPEQPDLEQRVSELEIKLTAALKTIETLQTEIARIKGEEPTATSPREIVEIQGAVAAKVSEPQQQDPRPTLDAWKGFIEDLILNVGPGRTPKRGETMRKRHIPPGKGTAQVAIDWLEEEFDQLDSNTLYVVFDFLSDCTDEKDNLGGSFNGLQTNNPQLKRIRLKLLDRLCTEEANNLDDYRFDRLLFRVRDTFMEDTRGMNRTQLVELAKKVKIMVVDSDHIQEARRFNEKVKNTTRTHEADEPTFLTFREEFLRTPLGEREHLIEKFGINRNNIRQASEVIQNELADKIEVFSSDEILGTIRCIEALQGTYPVELNKKLRAKIIDRMLNNEDEFSVGTYVTLAVHLDATDRKNLGRRRELREKPLTEWKSYMKEPLQQTMEWCRKS